MKHVFQLLAALLKWQLLFIKHLLLSRNNLRDCLYYYIFTILLPGRFYDHLDGGGQMQSLRQSYSTTLKNRSYFILDMAVFKPKFWPRFWPHKPFLYLENNHFFSQDRKMLFPQWLSSPWKWDSVLPKAHTALHDMPYMSKDLCTSCTLCLPVVP